ncbi:MAG: hypothetical protein IJZ47_03910 [Oscillospiraceae bacterium]|nr:hypothetical protein [Oscillospiraceae bacterium]
MYIEKYWGDYIGGSDDSLTLMEYFAHKSLELTLADIFTDIGLDKFDGDLRQTDDLSVEIDDMEVEIQYAISIIADLAALLLECKVNGSVDLNELWEELDGELTLTATAEENEIINAALKLFAEAPTEYDISEMMDEDELAEMAELIAELRQELYG